MEKIIDMNHHVHDYECMWNGIEDIYMGQTGESLPDNFFFLLSGFGSFCYLKTNKAQLKRMVALGDGRTKKMYEFLAPIVGFEYRHYECKTFQKALDKAKGEIDKGFPVILGALDMYYLPYYPKLYHGEHIPFHYVMMAGYSDEKKCVYLYDCGRPQLIPFSWEELEKSMDCSYPGLSRENTVCTIRMNSSKDKYQIAREALARKKELFLNPPTGFLGHRGFEKFIFELPGWREELGKAQYDELLKNMVMFFGTVPTVPNALRGIGQPDSVVFKGSFDKMSRMLTEMGTEYRNDRWREAALYFQQGAGLIEEISGLIIAYLSGKNDETERMPALFSGVLEKMREGYSALDV